MKLSDMSKVELELLSYTDLTDMILKESKKPMNTPSIFRKICDLLGYNDEQYAAKIGDYYTSLTIDKRFHLLDSGEWDLSNNHVIPLEIDDEDESDEILDDEEETDESAETEEETEEDDIDSIIDDEELDDEVDDLDDLAILDDEEELEES